MRNLHRYLLLLVAGLLLAGCEMRSWVDIDLSDLEAGSVVLTIGLDEQFRSVMEQAGEGADFFEGIEESAGEEGWEVARFVDGEIEGFTVTRRFTSLEEMISALESSPLEGGGAETPTVEGMSLTDSGDTIIFEGSVPSAGGDELEGVDPQQILGLITFDARVSVTFPGDVIEHNGELSGRTVTWRFYQDDLNGVEMYAEARKAGGVSWPVIVAAILALAVASVVVYQGRRYFRPVEPEPELEVDPGSLRSRLYAAKALTVEEISAAGSQSARPVGFGSVRLPSIPSWLGLVALAGLLLPFFSISCVGVTLVEAEGWKLATGSPVNAAGLEALSSGFDSMPAVAPAPPDDYAIFSPWVAAAALALLVAVAMSLSLRPKAEWTIALFVGASASLLGFWLWLRDGFAEAQAFGVELHAGSGIWLTGLASLGAGMLTWTGSASRLTWRLVAVIVLVVGVGWAGTWVAAGGAN